MLCIILLGGCSTGTGSESELSLSGEFAFQGLAEMEVHSMKEYEGVVYAATDSGLFVKQNQTGKWDRLGTLNAKVGALVLLPNNEIIAALISGHKDSFNIVRSIDNGETWQDYRNGFGGPNRYRTYILEAHKNFPNRIYARSFMSVAKSEDGAKSWSLVYLNWDNLSGKMFLTINPFDPEIIWAGGANVISEPILIRSTDGGGSWERLSVLENIEATVFDVATRYKHPKHIMITIGSVMRSYDNGYNWETVFSEGGILSFTHSVRYYDIVYGGGMNQQGKLFLVANKDFGDTWESENFEDSPVGIWVNDMVSVMKDGKEVLYFATNKGVYSYTFSE